MMLWIEVAVALGLAAIFVIAAFLLYKPEHVDGQRGKVLAGAGLQGFILGAVVGFVILPLRIGFFAPDTELAAEAAASHGGIASLAILPAFIALIVVRRGLLARAPLIGTLIRAYRRAALKWQIDGASKALARLEAIDEKKAAP